MHRLRARSGDALRRQFLGLVAALACAPQPPPGGEWRERGAAVVGPFKQQLVKELTAALEQDGPEHAIAVCGVRAPELAREATTESIRIGRTSHRLRNPANEPREWVAPLLAEYVADPAQKEPRAVWLDSGDVGYVEPIFTAPLCLPCHGDALAPALEARIRERYPADRATGFQQGELRGLFWVELAAKPGKALR